MSALICGSMAYDTIMVFPELFKDHILPDKIHILNVCFQVPQMRREYGGCAGNIAYNLKLLGGEGAPMATVGTDFRPYAEWMDAHGVSRKYIKEVPETFTAQAFITTDIADNQITAFHPGAMDHAHTQSVPRNAGITLGIVAPDGRDGMLKHASEFSAAGVPFIFDPGQGLPLFSGEELNNFIELADWVVVNDYEMQVLERKTGLTAYQIAERVNALIVTWGGKGSVIYTQGRRLDIPAAKPDATLDPTGCGDAYRAGLLYGIMNGRDMETTGHIASLLGAIKIASRGTQNHRFTHPEFATRFEAAFGYTL
ncbi:MAG TPA: carbohydrate kinase family protein [Gammaproteobacteria bacterium]|jgi:adenosine kinase|nr:carbohydrate kinase family protein [Gammaproteobacteria bacterium]